MNHRASLADRAFCNGFEGLTILAEDFDHRAHVRLAYVHLCDCDPPTASLRMKQALLAFLAHHGASRTKFHETLTKAWIDAVKHFMAETKACASFEEFIHANSILLDSKIMLSHYSAELLFSDRARARYVDPDLEPIPEHDPVRSRNCSAP